MFITIFLILIGFYLENRFSPRITLKNDEVSVVYRAKRSDKEKTTQKLFSI